MANQVSTLVNLYSNGKRHQRKKIKIYFWRLIGEMKKTQMRYLRLLQFRLVSEGLSTKVKFELCGKKESGVVS